MNNIKLDHGDVEPGDIVAAKDKIWVVDDVVYNGWVKVYLDGDPDVKTSLRAKDITDYQRTDKTGSIEYKPPTVPKPLTRRQKLFRTLRKMQDTYEYRKGIGYAVQAVQSIRAALATRLPGEKWEVLS